MRPVVLVHGAWHGAWCWNAVVDGLDAVGVRSVAVDLPSVNRPDATLADDADAVRAAIDALGEPVLLVGHSYGGAVVTDAGSHPAVDRLLFLTAFVLDESETLIVNELKGGELSLASRLEFDGDVSRVQRDQIVPSFFHDCAPEVAADAAVQLRDHSATSFGGTPRAVAWREKPSTYVVCTDDRAIPVAMQQSCAARIGDVREWPTGHSPFLSRPELVVELIREFV